MSDISKVDQRVSALAKQPIGKLTTAVVNGYKGADKVEAAFALRFGLHLAAIAVKCEASDTSLREESKTLGMSPAKISKYIRIGRTFYGIDTKSLPDSAELLYLIATARKLNDKGKAVPMFPDTDKGRERLANAVENGTINAKLQRNTFREAIGAVEPQRKTAPTKTESERMVAKVKSIIATFDKRSTDHAEFKKLAASLRNIIKRIAKVSATIDNTDARERVA